jgi:hypothetical protein
MHIKKLHNLRAKFSTNTVTDRSFIIYRPEWEQIIKIHVKENAYEDKDYIYGAQETNKWRDFVDTGMNFRAA